MKNVLQHFKLIDYLVAYICVFYVVVFFYMHAFKIYLSVSSYSIRQRM